MNDLEEYTDKEFENQYCYIKRLETKRAKVAVFPKAIILGGQPGSGKSSMIKNLGNLFQEAGTVVISGDDFRKQHPHFNDIYTRYGDEYVNYTQRFSSQVTERLIDELSKEKYNLIIEGTLRTAAVPIKTAKLLQSRGYQVELAVMAVPSVLSYVGTIERYEKMKEMGLTPRMTTKLQHDNTVRSIISSLDEVYHAAVFDDILLYNRKSECLYRQKETPEKNPREVLKFEHNRELTTAERTYLDNAVKFIEDCQRRNQDDCYETSIQEMHVTVGESCFKYDLLKNGFVFTDQLQNNYNQLVKSTGRLWKLYEIADRFNSGKELNTALKNIGEELRAQELLHSVEIQPGP